MGTTDSFLDNLEGFDDICRLITSRLSCDRCIISVVSHEALFSVGHSSKQIRLAGRIRSLRDTVCQHTMSSDGPLVLRDASQVEWLQSTKGVKNLGIKAYLGVPLVIDEKGVIGAMCAVNFTPRLWSDRDIDFLSEFVDLIQSRIHRDMLRYENDALSTELNETDTILSLLAHSTTPAVSVHDRAGSLIFANQEFFGRVVSEKNGVPDVPWPQIDEARNTRAAGEVEVVLNLVGRGEMPVRTSYVSEPNGLMLCNWWLPEPAV